MNWIQENKFLSGLIAVTVVGAALLVFLLLGARGRFAETSVRYDQLTAELQRLQALKPYPEEGNLKLLTDQRDQHAAEVQELREQLADLELPRESVSPAEFQDRLRSQVSEIEALAQENGVALPEGFYLGFSEYQGTPPRGEATALLEWQLKSIVLVVKTIIQAKVASIDSIDREPLAQESAGAPSPAAARRGSAPPAETAEAPLVQRYPFTIAFTAEQSRLRSILNQITKTKEQFLIPRTLKIENEQLAGPSKEVVAPDAFVMDAPVADAPAEGVGTDAESLQRLIEGTATADEAKEAVRTLSFIVGTEKVKVVMTIDVVDFAVTDQAEGTGAAAAR